MTVKDKTLIEKIKYMEREEVGTGEMVAPAH
jgi:hypothetical protein